MSHAGQKIQELTLKRVILLILAIIISLVFFDTDLWKSNSSVVLNSLDLFSHMTNYTEIQNLFNSTISEINYKNEFLIKYLKIYNLTYGDKNYITVRYI